jgi:hypothetical protein
VAHLALKYVHSTGLSAFLHNFGEEFSGRHKSFTVRSAWTLLDKDDWIENTSHDDFSCRRCLASEENVFALRDWDPVQVPSREEHGAILVAALKQGANQESQDRHELCLYLSKKSSHSLEGVPFSKTIEGLAQGGHICHTILHALFDESVRSDAIL